MGLETSTGVWKQTSENMRIQLHVLLTMLEGYETHREGLDIIIPFKVFVMCVEDFQKSLSETFDVICESIKKDAEASIRTSQILLDERKANPLFATAVPMDQIVDVQKTKSRKGELDTRVTEMFSPLFEDVISLGRRTLAITVLKEK